MEKFEIEVEVINTKAQAQRFFKDFYFNTDALVTLYALVNSTLSSRTAIYEALRNIDGRRETEGRKFFTALQNNSVVVMTYSGKTAVIPLDEDVIRDVCGICND